MFVLSMKSKHIKKIVALFACAAAVAAVVLVCASMDKEKEVSKSNMMSERAAKTNEDRLAFISKLGWEVKEEPIEIQEIIIPEEFDETYENYNELQLTQDFDLSELKGKRVKRWTYLVTNYPDASPDDESIRLNMLVCDGKIVGGDVCSVRLDGFMHGFSMPTE